jgi:cobalt-zinc-cadmium efflux system membrane fusion protein
MTRWTPILLLAALAGCSRQQPEPVKAVAEPPAASEQSVVLEPAAQKEAGIVAEAVELRSMPRTLQATGRIAVNENQTWRVGAITEGRIIRVYANVGDMVRQGHVLARMHSHDIHEARAQYRRALAERARLKTAESYTQRVRDRARRLFELKAGSLEQVEQAEAGLRNTQTELANAEVEVERTRKHLVEFLEIPADEPKEHKAGYQETDEDLIPIRSPAAGVVLARNVTPGTVVTTSGDLFVVSDLSAPWMIASVGEEHLAELRVGIPVKVYVQAYGTRAFHGRIGRLDEELDPTTRTIKARVEVPNPHGHLKPEMYATAEIQLGESEPALFVPQEAVQELDGQTSVFVRTALNRFVPRTVRTGRTFDGTVEVLRGLRPGEVVVTRGSYVLKSQLLKGALGEE